MQNDGVIDDEEFILLYEQYFRETLIFRTTVTLILTLNNSMNPSAWLNLDLERERYSGSFGCPSNSCLHQVTIKQAKLEVFYSTLFLKN